MKYYKDPVIYHNGKPEVAAESSEAGRAGTMAYQILTNHMMSEDRKTLHNEFGST